MRFSAIREWLNNQRLAWTAAWHEVWQEKFELERKSQTIIVPLEEYCVLLEAANREAKALELLGEAQETIRVLKATVAKQDEILQREAAIGLDLSQVLIDRMV